MAAANDDTRFAELRPRNRILGQVTRAGTVALTIALSGVAITTVAISLDALRYSLGHVDYTEEVLRHSTVLGSAIGNSEASARGYMLAHDAKFLTRFNIARGAILEEISTLLRLTSGDPPQVQRLDQLYNELTVQLGDLSKPLSRQDARLKTILASIDASPSLRMAPRIDNTLAAFRNTEFDLLRERQAAATSETTNAMLLALLTGLLAAVSGVAGIYLFVRERARLERQKMRAEFLHISRLNAMGEATAMLAHEVKQPLSAASNYLNALLRLLSASAGEPAAKVVDITQKASAQVARAVEIIQRLRDFVRKSEQSFTTENVASLVAEALSLMGPEPHDIRIVRQIAPDLPPVRVDKIQIQQVLVNLVRNAMEAMAASPRRELILRAMPEGEAAIRIEVIDSGPGLPETVAQKLFQPFVTTKEGGMGVGLSICHTIIMAHGGKIGAAANPAGGTIFYFSLPRA